MDYCICSQIPQLTLTTHLSLVIHKNELKRTSNTGQLALRALVNSKMHVVGEINQQFQLEDILLSDHQNLLFYPSDESVELNEAFLSSIKKPIHLIVPDGNWRQASKVHYRNKHLENLPRVKIDLVNTGTQFLRTESKPIGMATLEAIAHALGIIEGDTVKSQLLNLYQIKLQNTLIARGQANLLQKS